MPLLKSFSCARSYWLGERGARWDVGRSEIRNILEPCLDCIVYRGSSHGQQG